MKGISKALYKSFTLSKDTDIVLTGDEAKKQHKLKVGNNLAFAATLTLTFYYLHADRDDYLYWNPRI